MTQPISDNTKLTPTITRQCAIDMIDLSMRLEKIIYVGTEDAFDPAGDLERLFIEGCYLEEDFFVDKPNYLLVHTDDPVDALEAFLEEEVQGTPGLLVVFNTPVPFDVRFNEDGEVASWNSTWGHYWTKVMYGVNLPKVIEAGMEWATRIKAEHIEKNHKATSVNMA